MNEIQNMWALVYKGSRDNSLIDVYLCPECGTRYLNIIDLERDYENGFMYEANNLSELNVDERLNLFPANHLMWLARGVPGGKISGMI